MLQNLALPAPQQSSKCLFKVFCGWYKVEGQVRPETLDNDTELTTHSLGTGGPGHLQEGRKDGMLTGLKTKTIWSLYFIVISVLQSNERLEPDWLS